MKKIYDISILFIAFISGSITFGQAPQDSELYQVLKEKDSILFDAAFNRCDPATLKTLFTEDFEFYHDKGGLTESRQAFLEPLEQNCPNVKPEDLQPSKRFLIEGSLEVYPMYKNGELYGAIQHGVHRFEFLNDNKEYQQGDIAKFTHVWIKENDRWKIKRELSYDHKLLKE